jgi:shikimate kinase
MVAEGLNARVSDIDATIEQKSGISIAEIFCTRGEDHFRRLERREMATALARNPRIIVPGGGWAAQPGSFESVAARAVTVYLATSPQTALERISRGAETRPLLMVADPAGMMDELLAARKPHYERCDHTVPTDGRTPEQVAREVMELALESEGQ